MLHRDRVLDTNALKRFTVSTAAGKPASDLVEAFGAKKLDIMIKVGIPRALPYFFGSLEIAITLAFIGSVLSETQAANHGLGHMMLIAQANFEVRLVFSCLMALAIEGIGMYAIVARLEMRMTGWAHRSGFSAQ